jgi:hypothetical protein
MNPAYNILLALVIISGINYKSLQLPKLSSIIWSAKKLFPMFHSTFYSLLSTLLLLPSFALSEFIPCPLLGPSFPAPPASSIQTTSKIQDALLELTQKLDENVATGNGSHGPTYPNSTSFGIALFSTENYFSNTSSTEEPFFYQYHHSSPHLQLSKNGVKKVDADSVYRIGTLTQLFTVYTFLLNAGDCYWGMPVTNFVPELVEEGKKSGVDSNPMLYTSWEDVMLGELASHMAGIGRDCKLSLYCTQPLVLPYKFITFESVWISDKIFHRLKCKEIGANIGLKMDSQTFSTKTSHPQHTACHH